jgi:hypothetical protein
MVAVAALAVGAGCQSTPSGQTMCMSDYGNRIGHSTSDNAFWQHLQDCARKNLLPAGANDPAYYSADGN